MLIIARHDKPDTTNYRNQNGLLSDIEAGADMAHFSVRLTKDNELILSHHVHLNGDRRLPKIRKSSLKQLNRFTAGSTNQIVTLEQVLKNAFGEIMLLVEIREISAVKPLLELLEPYVKKVRAWHNILIGSPSGLVLATLRHYAPQALLSLSHHRNLLSFLALHPGLNLNAVGFHRLHINSTVVDAAHQLDLLTYAYTVNRQPALAQMEKIGVDAILTDNPTRFSQARSLSSK